MHVFANVCVASAGVCVLEYFWVYMHVRGCECMCVLACARESERKKDFK